MRVIVSGASGVIAFKLIKEFLEKGHCVLSITRKTTVSLKQLYSCFPSSGKICELSTDNLFTEIKEFNPDVIFSTTCCYEADSKALDKIIDANYVFPATLLRIADYCSSKEHNVRFISLGTSLPKYVNIYSLTKNQFSDLGYFFAKPEKLIFIDVKLESFYGPEEPQDRFISSSIIKMLKGENLEVTLGIQHRDYVFLADVINVLYFLAITESLSECYYSIPLGTGISPSIREILEFLKKETQTTSKILFGARAMRKEEPSTKADLKILRELGYNNAFVPWTEGMKIMIEELKNEYFN